MININDLTLGQIKQIKEINPLTNSTSISTETQCPVEIGKAYLFRTVTHIELGRVTKVQGQFITLEDASWVADTGRYHNALKDGTLSEIEPYPISTIVNLQSMINIVPWPHPLPREQK